MASLAGKRILVTGGSGFLGSHAVTTLQEREANVVAPRSTDYDLRDSEAIRAILRDHDPEIVLHLAAVVGGIGANMAEPGRFFYENAIMGIHLIEESRL